MRGNAGEGVPLWKAQAKPRLRTNLIWVGAWCAWQKALALGMQRFGDTSPPIPARFNPGQGLKTRSGDARSEMLQQIADGIPTREIASASNTSQQVIKNCTDRASQKLGADNRGHLIAVAFRAGLIK